MIVFSHRGLDLERKEPLPENSLASFRLAAQAGQGIEVDLQMTRSKELLIAHDMDLARWSGGGNTLAWRDLSSDEIEKLEPQYGPICRFRDVMELAVEFPKLRLALHLKGTNQDKAFLQELTSALAEHSNLHSRVLIFDLRVESAQVLRHEFSRVNLAPSVATHFDITRYQKVANGTLLEPESALVLGELFDWVWLDEWDRVDADGGWKSLYSVEMVARFQAAGFKIAVVSPELHRHESHQDAKDLESLRRRWKEILELKPDAICTDYPARLMTLSPES